MHTWTQSFSVSVSEACACLASTIFSVFRTAKHPENRATVISVRYTYADFFIYLLSCLAIVLTVLSVEIFHWKNAGGYIPSFYMLCRKLSYTFSHTALMWRIYRIIPTHAALSSRNVQENLLHFCSHTTHSRIVQEISCTFIHTELSSGKV